MDQPHLPTPKESFKTDLSASVVVFLVALPLCLGIALASGAPITGGIIAGIIGGIVVGLLSGSPLSVSGPAAGLVIICLQGIQQMGSYELFLVAVILAGLIQLIFGFLKLGIIGEYVPTAVVQGMLAGIGLVIILKEIPHALGRDKDFLGDLKFIQDSDHENSFSAIGAALFSMNISAAVIAVLSLIVLFSYDSIFSSNSKIRAFIPAPLFVVAIGIGLAKFFEQVFPEFAMTAQAGHFVELPSILEPGELSKLPLPNFEALLAPAKLIPLALLIAVIASLETLLSIEAVDKLDPYRRLSPPNRELKAQGLGNILSGLLGGVPITAVIVRSSANVYAGGKTNLATIFHGILLVVAVVFLPALLKLIPLSCLAAILIHVGYKLSPPKLYKKMRTAGLDQFLPFIATILGIIFTDLLTGVSIGLVIGIFYVLKLNHHNAVTFVQEGNDFLLRFNKDISFINKMELKDALKLVPDGVNLVIDGTRAMYIDRDIFDVLTDFEKNCRHRGISLKLRNIEEKVLRLAHLKGAHG